MVNTFSLFSLDDIYAIKQLYNKDDPLEFEEWIATDLDIFKGAVAVFFAGEVGTQELSRILF